MSQSENEICSTNISNVDNFERKYNARDVKKSTIRPEKESFKAMNSIYYST